MKKEKLEGISFFEKYLSVWVALCIIAGVAIGKFLPQIPNFLSRFEYAQVSIPIAILIWLMIFPMMLKIDFTISNKFIACIFNNGKNAIFVEMKFRFWGRVRKIEALKITRLVTLAILVFLLLRIKFVDRC